MPEGIEFSVSDPDLDPAELNQLFRVVGWDSAGHRTVEKTASMLRSTLLYATARSQAGLVGFGRLLGDAYVAQILDVIVHPDYRRRGIAKQITRRLLDNLPAGLIGVSLVDGSGYPELYESLGFEAADVESNRLMFLRTDLVPGGSR